MIEKSMTRDDGKPTVRWWCVDPDWTQRLPTSSSAAVVLHGKESTIPQSSPLLAPELIHQLHPIFVTCHIRNNGVSCVLTLELVPMANTYSHPKHPAFVHFPIVFTCLTGGLDAVYYFSSQPATSALVGSVCKCQRHSNGSTL